MREISQIIETLGRHADESAVRVLEDVGTNCPDEFVRQVTAKALVNRNSEDSLRIILTREGKGLYDMNPSVVEAVVDSLRNLSDKSEAIKLLDDASINGPNDFVRSKAYEVKQLIASFN
jgi:hypothetical protein